MLFDDLLKNALGDDSEPFQDLFSKAMSWDGASLGKKKKTTITPVAETAPAPAPAKTKAVAPAKVPVSGGSPVKAKKKTGIQIDSNTAPVKQNIVTPDGPQQKTFHEGVGGEPTSTKTPLIIPAKKTGTKKKQTTPDVTYTPHPSGENVATGHQTGQVPVDIKMDARGQWYHDRLQPGDKIGFNGWSSEFNHWVPVQSEVSELNPNGTKLIHAKPIHKDAIDDPEAEPLKVHYNKLHFFRRRSEDDPGKWDHFEYPGEYEQPKSTDPQGAKPTPVMSPEEHHAHTVHQQELVKMKTDGIKKHIEGGDVVEFWMVDPNTNKLALQRGTVHNMAPSGGAAGAKGGKKGGKEGEAPEINNLIVQTKDGYEDVPLDQVKRFGKYVVDELHLYSFDPKQEKWARDSKSGQEMQPPTDKAPEATGVPSNMPHPVTTTPVAPGQQPAAAPQTPVPTGEQPAQPTDKPNFADEPQDPSHVIMSAGGKYVDEDPEENLVYFQDPTSGRVHAMPKDEVNTQNVLSKLGKVPQVAAKDSFHTPDEVEQHKQQDITQHWTHQMPEDLVGHVRGLIDKLDNHSKNGEPLPPSILMARHRLLHDYDSKKAMKNAAHIEEFLQNPNAIPKVKPPMQRQDFQKKFNGASNFNSISFDDAKAKLGTTKLAHPILENKQQKALATLDQMAQKNNLGGFAGAIHQIDPKIDNRNLINFYKMKLEDALKGKGETHEPIHLDMPSDDNIDHARHVNEMAQHLKDNKLLIPAYRKKLEQLHYFLENAPDSPMIERLTNQIHKYGYVHGPNDPRFQSHMIGHQLNELPKGKYDPQAVAQIQHLLKRVDEGQVGNPSDYVMLANKIAKDKGIPLEEMPKVPFNGSAQAKSKLDALIAHRKVAEQEKKQEADQQQQQAEKAPMEPPQATLPQDAQQQQQYVQGNMKGAQRLLQGAQNNEKVYNQILQELKDQHITKPDEETLKVLRNIYASIQRAVGENKKYQQELGKFGVQIPDYVPNVQPFTGGEEQQPNPSVDQVHSNISRTFNNFDEKKKAWLENQVGFAHNDIQQMRSHFLSGVQHQLPSVQQDLKDIDQGIGDMLNQQKWQPLDIGMAKTPQGKQFLQMVNEKIETLRKREQLAGVTIDEALGKSLDEIISAEKTLARRDVSLALRKAFSNEKESSEIQRANQLLGSYVDDFVQTVMTTYVNIPVTVRKSIGRKLIKSMILSVIKENEFSAINMDSDFSVPLDDVVVKSLGQRVASIVTEFRLEANPSKQMFVIDVAKAEDAPARELSYFTHTHSLIKSDAPMTRDLWLPLMGDLEQNMYKAGMLETIVSPHRIKKFIADNDQSVLTEFYNENVKALNARLEELANGRR